MTPSKEDYEKALKICRGSVHFEAGAIPCCCEGIAQALAEARKEEAEFWHRVYSR